MAYADLIAAIMNSPAPAPRVLPGDVSAYLSSNGAAPDAGGSPLGQVGGSVLKNAMSKNLFGGTTGDASVAGELGSDASAAGAAPDALTSSLGGGDALSSLFGLDTSIPALTGADAAAGLGAGAGAADAGAGTVAGAMGADAAGTAAAGEGIASILPWLAALFA